MSTPAHVVPRSTGAPNADGDRAGLARQHQVVRYLDPWGPSQIVWCHGHHLLRGHKVILNVYDLLPARFNGCLAVVGLGGAYHSGVEVGGTEYAFGGHWSDELGLMELRQPLHVTRREAQEAAQRGEDSDGSAAAALEWLPPLRSRSVVGWWMGPLGDLELVMRHMQNQEQWVGSAYRLLTRNCNHFSRALCEVLLRSPHFKPAPGATRAELMVPPTLTRLTSLAAALGRCMPCCDRRLNVPMPLAPYALNVFQGRGRTCRTRISFKICATYRSSIGSAASVISLVEDKKQACEQQQQQQRRQLGPAADGRLPVITNAAAAGDGGGGSGGNAAAEVSDISPLPSRLRLGDSVIVIGGSSCDLGQDAAGLRGKVEQGDKAASAAAAAATGAMAKVPVVHRATDGGHALTVIASAVSATRAASEVQAAGRGPQDPPRVQLMARSSSSRGNEGAATAAAAHMPTITELGVTPHNRSFRVSRDGSVAAAAAAVIAATAAAFGGRDGPHGREPSGSLLRRPRSLSAGPTGPRPSCSSSSSIGVELPTAASAAPATEPMATAVAAGAPSPSGAAAKLLAHSRSGRRVFPDPRVVPVLAAEGVATAAATDGSGSGGCAPDAACKDGPRSTGTEPLSTSPSAREASIGSSSGSRPCSCVHPPTHPQLQLHSPQPCQPRARTPPGLPRPTTPTETPSTPAAGSPAAGSGGGAASEGGAASPGAPSPSDRTSRQHQRQRLSPLPLLSPRSLFSGVQLSPPAPAAAAPPPPTQQQHQQQQSSSRPSSSHSLSAASPPPPPPLVVATVAPKSAADAVGTSEGQPPQQQPPQQQQHRQHPFLTVTSPRAAPPAKSPTSPAALSPVKQPLSSPGSAAAPTTPASHNNNHVNISRSSRNAVAPLDLPPPAQHHPHHLQQQQQQPAKQGGQQPQPQQQPEAPRRWSVMSGGFIDLLFARSALTTPEPALPPPPPGFATHDGMAALAGEGGGGGAAVGAGGGGGGGGRATHTGIFGPGLAAAPVSTSGPNATVFGARSGEVSWAPSGGDGATSVAPAAAGGGAASREVQLATAVSDPERTAAHLHSHLHPHSQHPHPHQQHHQQHSPLSPRSGRSMPAMGSVVPPVAGSVLPGVVVPVPVPRAQSGRPRATE
ncbi:hypothetical protein Agub_g5225 [Astrephomene gubernaculifera]|uniref:PPPDE domain-containing protein n=1 Tax=Astrephomene gubernaculifera TaxID=47775 RepID=A0AAD3DLI7_9CHLO|nr:hypothetical protein Agub_g5225 [Astrephomene gubernaculifera]